ncbi:MAG: hypothetical protein AAF798_15335 [Bacteroidota bacterium]
MEIWLSTILEILKLTIPGLIVFLTVYYSLRQFLNNQYQLRLLELKQGQQSTSTPLKFQAYERLSLFCERISIPNLLLRVRQDSMNATQLRIALLFAIQQEFEHNITQQVYVTDQLWQIIKIARDDAVNMVAIAAEQVDGKAPSTDLSTALMQIIAQREVVGIDTALQAIKKEASLML